MKVLLSSVCLFSLIACAMAVTCQSGVKNYAVDTVTDTNCTTSCIRIDYMVHSIAKGMPISFEQSSFSCTSAGLSCIDKEATCKQLTNAIENNAGGFAIKIEDCKATCCSTNSCNKPEGEYKLSYGSQNDNVLPNVSSTVMSIAMTTVPFTVSKAVSTTTRPKLIETPTKGRYLRCHTGTINVAYDSYSSSSSCTTACLTNEIDVTAVIKGTGFSFPQTTFSCAPHLDYCNNNLICKQLKPAVSKLDIPSATSIQAENCKTKCCYSSKCNARDPSRIYNIKWQKKSLRAKLDPKAS